MKPLCLGILKSLTKICCQRGILYGVLLRRRVKSAGYSSPIDTAVIFTSAVRNRTQQSATRVFVMGQFQNSPSWGRPLQAAVARPVALKKGIVARTIAIVARGQRSIANRVVPVLAISNPTRALQ
jgi:hypothetical protein